MHCMPVNVQDVIFVVPESIAICVYWLVNSIVLVRRLLSFLLCSLNVYVCQVFDRSTDDCSPWGEFPGDHRRQKSTEQLTLYSAKAFIVPHRIIWSWYTGHRWMGWYTWYCVGCSPPRPVLVLPNVTAHPSAASVLITILLYDGLLLCGFNVPLKG